MMKQIVYELTAPKKLNKKEIEITGDVSPDEIYAETEYSIISAGTELAAWLGKPPLRSTAIYPRLIGYCNLAKVKKRGALVTDIAINDYILTHQSHRSGFICNRSDILLTFKNLNENDKKKITSTYLYHLAYSALLAAHYQPGLKVAILGMGVLGIATASLMNAWNATPILFTNQSLKFPWIDHNLPQIYEKKYSTSHATHLFEIDGFDIVINTSDQWSDYHLGLELIRKGGTIICLGFPGRGQNAPEFNPLDSQYFYDKQLIIKHCGHVAQLDAQAIDIRFTLKRNMHYLAELILKSAINPFDIISIESDWTLLESVYQTLSLRKEGIHTAVLRWKP